MAESRENRSNNKSWPYIYNKHKASSANNTVIHSLSSTSVIYSHSHSVHTPDLLLLLKKFPVILFQLSLNTISFFFVSNVCLQQVAVSNVNGDGSVGIYDGDSMYLILKCIWPVTLVGDIDIHVYVHMLQRKGEVKVLWHGAIATSEVEFEHE